MIRAIVAVDNKWGIGKNNDLLFRLPEDMRRFRAITLGNIIVMGSNTLKSFPDGKPLPGRVNVVLWPDGEKRNDCLVAGSLDELRSILSRYRERDIFVVGGAMFYRTMLPYCSEVLVTRVNADGGAAVFFENLDELSGWTKASEKPPFLDGEYEIAFASYRNLQPRDFFAEN